jgi:trk system potassium uptake protein TrkH
MNFKLVFRLTGRTLLVASVSLLFPLLVAIYYRENPFPFLLTFFLTALVGLCLSRFRSSDSFFSREGFFSVGLIWVLMGALGALPFWFYSGIAGDPAFSSYIDCLFESISGFTTTGASILTEVEHLPYSILFWRSFTHWLGGMGVLVLTIALLPSLGARALHLMRAESPGPVTSKLVPKTSDSSKILYGIYIALTLLQILLLCLAGMPLFDSVANSMATAGTGGFAIKNLSIGAYANPAFEWIITIFMLLFSVNFALYFLVLRGKWRQALKSDELRFFGGVVLFSGLFIALNTSRFYPSVLDALRHAFFQVASIISTTGFSSVDFNLWPEFSRTLLVILMFCGACAGSTGGGIKCSRILILFKALFREIKQIIHPRSVNVVKLDGQVLEESTIKSILVFFSTYMLITFGAALLVALDNFSFGTTLTAVVACISNIGPGLEAVGPMGNFSLFSPFSKLVLSLCMVVGRLEIFPILVLFSRSAWRRA